MRIVIIGARGQLGRDLESRLVGKVFGLGRSDLDLTDLRSLPGRLDALNPDIVVNAAAYNFVDRAESEAETAFAINAWGVRALAQWCTRHDRLLVHFSTDYVFGLDSGRREPYRETDTPGPLGIYGLSKLAGEFCVQAICPRHLIIRTCGLYGVWGSGGKGGNFVETMLKKAADQQPLRVVQDQFCTPTYTVDLALATRALLEARAHGLYHFTNDGALTWYDFAKAIFEFEDIRADLSPIPASAFLSASRRPQFSVLATQRFQSLGLGKPRPWKDALMAYLAERKKVPR